ncbi:hypothetical protein CBS101457_003362 [Exobasidium rhododendri]|nr:hypothetical protein CBS101457_003362 [Exobasidium rhododendri]
MQFFEHSLLALLAISTTTSVLAAPATTKEPIEIAITKKRDVFSHPNSNRVDYAKVTKHMDHLKAKYASSLQAYEVNTGNKHPLNILEDVVPAQKRAKSSLSLTAEGQSLWRGAITIGTNTSQCDFDTGSADIIIQKSGYKPGKSSKNTGKTFTAEYGDGTTASGTVYTDTVTVGKLTAGGVSIGRSTATFLDASEGISGICGMSYPSLSVLGSGSTPFFDAMINAKVVTSSIFTFTLSTGASHLYLGGVSPKVVSPTYVNIDTNPGYWLVSSTTLGGVSTASIVDTGTSVIVAPMSTAQAFFKAVGASTFTEDDTLYGTYPCKSPPSFTYNFGSFSTKLSASTISIGTADDGSCVLSVIGQDTGVNAVIAGDSFLQNVYAVFDRSSNRIGFSSQP